MNESRKITLKLCSKGFKFVLEQYQQSAITHKRTQPSQDLIENKTKGVWETFDTLTYKNITDIWLQWKNGKSCSLKHPLKLYKQLYLHHFYQMWSKTAQEMTEERNSNLKG